MKAKIIFDSEGWKALKGLQTNHLTVNKEWEQWCQERNGEKWKEGGSPPGRGRGKLYRRLDRSFASNYNVNDWLVSCWRGWDPQGGDRRSLLPILSHFNFLVLDASSQLSLQSFSFWNVSLHLFYSDHKLFFRKVPSLPSFLSLCLSNSLSPALLPFCSGCLFPFLSYLPFILL